MSRRTLLLIGIWLAAGIVVLVIWLGTDPGEQPPPPVSDDGAPVRVAGEDRAPEESRIALPVRPPPPGPPRTFRGDRRHTARSDQVGPASADLLWAFETGGRITAQAVVADDGTSVTLPFRVAPRHRAAALDDTGPLRRNVALAAFEGRVVAATGAAETGRWAADNVIDGYVISDRAGDPNLGNVRVDDTVLFAYNSAEIAPEFEPLLNQASLLLAIRPLVTMTIEGHTDSIGSDERNLELSQERAEAVVAYLVERGAEPERLTAVGKGESEPIASNRDEAGRELNRRIQVFIENLLAE